MRERESDVGVLWVKEVLWAWTILVLLLIVVAGSMIISSGRSLHLETFHKIPLPLPCKLPALFEVWLSRKGFLWTSGFFVASHSMTKHQWPENQIRWFTDLFFYLSLFRYNKTAILKKNIVVLVTVFRTIHNHTYQQCAHTSTVLYIKTFNH